MNCPKCGSLPLEHLLGPKGAVVDLCRKCYGIWLDKGEIYHYASRPKQVWAHLEKASAAAADASGSCPRCKVLMKKLRLEAAALDIESCPACGGIWLDEGEVVALNSALGTGIDPYDQDRFRAAAPPAARLEFVAPGPQEAARQSFQASAGAPLTALPSLALRSGATLAGLYGVLAAFVYMIVAYCQLELGLALSIAAAVIFVNFLIGPLLADISLSWLHKLRWYKPEELPPYLKNFIEEQFKKRGFAFPSVGIIEDGNPNAFTYGNYPGNARIVLTRGLLDVLNEDEVIAVTAHEIGHVMHWDMAVMTLAALVPILLYYVYRFCMRSSRRMRPSSSGKKGGNPLLLIGLVALLLHYVTEYVVLFLSRAREYYADRYSGEATRNPNSLISALVKIAYGLAGQRKAEPQDKSQELPIAAAKTLGIFDATAAKALVASSLTGGGVSAANILGAMQWDIWNPWAGFYELNSTHPLTAKRIEYLGGQAASYGQRPLLHFDLQRPESYWDDFLTDIFFLWIPLGAPAVLIVLGLFVGGFAPGIFSPWAFIPHALCAGYMAKIWFSYKTGFYPDMSVCALLKRVKVSRVRGVAARIKGKIIGRGIPGYLLSEDLVLQDQTGFIILDYDQPLAVFNWIFALARGEELIGKEVVVEGWYRRAPVPFFEVRRIQYEQRTSTCYTLEAKYAVALLFLAVAVFVTLK